MKKKAHKPAAALSAVAVFHMLNTVGKIAMVLPHGGTYEIGEEVQSAWGQPYPVKLKVTGKATPRAAQLQLNEVARLFKTLGFEWTPPVVEKDDNVYWLKEAK